MGFWAFRLLDGKTGLSIGTAAEIGVIGIAVIVGFAIVPTIPNHGSKICRLNQVTSDW
jgi:hypothetical protein